MVQPDPQLVGQFKRLSSAAGVFAVFVGVFVLLGWIFDVQTLQAVLPGLPRMMPNTACGLILSGLSLWSSHQPHRGGRVAGLASLSAAIVALLGLLTLLEYSLNRDLGIDQILIGGGTSDAVVPGRPSPPTALSFLCVGLALVIQRHGIGKHAADALGLGALIVSLVGLIGYMHGTPLFFRFDSYTGMALHTAVSLAVLSAGVLLIHPDRGISTVLTSAGVGGLMSRRLLPASLVIPLLIGWIRLRGERTGIFGPEIGASLMVTLSIIVLAALVLVTAGSLDRMDRDRQRAERQLLLSKQRMDLIIDTAYDAFVAIDGRGVITEWNRMAENLFHWTRSEAVGRSLAETIIPPRYRQAHQQGLNHFFATGAGPVLNKRLELSALRRDGSEFPVEISIRPLRIEEGYTFSSFIVDISERKRTEAKISQLNRDLERRATELETANRELEAFSYSVSHDLRAPLRAIAGYSNILLEDHSGRLDDEGKRVLHVVVSSTDRMSQLIDDLLEFGRLGRAELKLTLINMTALAQSVFRDLLAACPERRIETTVGLLPSCSGDQALLRQVLQNLIGNSIKYTRNRDLARIEIDGKPETDENLYFVRDNGVGFQMEYAHKLFGIFQRLHSAGEFEGTGVGLSLAQRVIQRHGGRIWAEGKPSEGATFFFTLPKSRKEDER